MYNQHTIKVFQQSVRAVGKTAASTLLTTLLLAIDFFYAAGNCQLLMYFASNSLFLKCVFITEYLVSIRLENLNLFHYLRYIMTDA